MMLLSLMSQQISAQGARGQQASVFDAKGVPECVEALPENPAPMGEVHLAAMPSEAAHLPSVDVSQMFGSIE